MAVEQYGDGWEVVRLPDGSFLFTTTAEPAAADEIGFAVEFDAISAAITGTIIDDSPDESDIVTGGKTVIITLTNDTWTADVGDDHGDTDDLIAGIDGDDDNPGGWDAVVRAHMVHGDITRTSPTVVTIILAAEATYDILANETVTVTIPASALTAAGEIVAAPTFEITFVAEGGVAPTAVIYGPLVGPLGGPI
jgi:hypothetical protein